MATLNELGKNSCSITYGPSSTGADLWFALKGIDDWVTNDTFQGTVTANGTTVTGVGTIFTTQVSVGDTIMIAGQVRTVASIGSDVQITISGGAFSPAIALPSSMKAINQALSGTVDLTIRGNTNGRINVTNGSTTIVGTGTFFLSDMTNSVTTATLTGTVALGTDGVITGSGTSFTTGADGSADRLQPGDSLWVAGQYFLVSTVTNNTSATVVTAPGVAISAGAGIAKATNGTIGRLISINGRVRQITAIASNISMTVNTAMDLTDSNLKVKVYPRGTLTVSAGSATVTGNNTNFSWDLLTGDQVWIGEELRTFTFSAQATTTATLTDYSGYSGTAINVLRQAVTAIPFYRDETFFNGVSTAFVNEIRVGDDLILDGTELTVVAITNTAQFRANFGFSHNVTGGTIYKKKKLHGFVREGTREGAASGNKFSVKTTITATTGTVITAGSTVINVASPTNINPNSILKIAGAGGPPVALTGQVTATGTTVSGTNTLFLSELHVGAEICIAGQHVVVASIASNVSLTTIETFTTAVASATPIYRTISQFFGIVAVAGNNVTVTVPIRQTLYHAGQNPPLVYAINAATDFVEFVYSAVNKSAEASTALYNTSQDRKYFGFRYLPLAQGGGSGTAVATAGSAYNLTVYERWVASYGQNNGVGINLAHLSDNTAVPATAATGGCIDLTSMTQTTGGFLYLFAKPRYFIIQGKTFGNVQLQWLGCVEFERAQPEDTGVGFGGATGVTIGGALPLSGTPGVAPWPAFGYVNGNRFPVGLTATATLPVANTQGTHGGVIAVPRVRCSTGDLVGLNAHIYSAYTITTGRWGHFFELGGSGSYTTPGVNPTAGALTNTANTIIQPHMGHMVPVYTNVYNSKRFMFSPVVVLGPSYDPDIRGRLFGLKVIPSNLGTLMDTVSVTIDSNDFYDTAQPAADHWVLTATTTTFRVSLAGTNFQSTRSLEDGSTQASNLVVTFTNNYRWGVPA